MENKSVTYTEVCVPLLAKHFDLLCKTGFMFNEERLKQVSFCGKYQGIEKESFSAKIFVRDHTGTVSILSYFLSNSQKSTCIVPDLQPGCYIKVFCLTRVEESRVSLILKHFVLISERTEINEFLSEVLIHQLKPCGFKLKEMISKCLSNAASEGFSAFEIQRQLLNYYSLYHVEKALLELIEEGMVDMGENFNKYVLNLPN